MPGLSIALLAFAAGATLLQWQPVLPSIAPWFAAAGASAIGALALLGLGTRLQIVGTRKLGFVALLNVLLIAASAGTFGFAYAPAR
jgi:hypothetical protein